MGGISRPTRTIKRDRNVVKTTTVTNKHSSYVESGGKKNPMNMEKGDKMSHTMIISAFNKKVFYFDLGLYKKWHEFEVEETLFTIEMLHPEHKNIVILGGSPSLFVYHIRDKVIVGGKYTKHQEGSKIYALKYIPKRNFIISGSSNGDLVLWKFHPHNLALSFCSLLKPSNEGRHVNRIISLNDEKESILLANNSRNLTLLSIDCLGKDELFENYKDFLYSKNKVSLRNGFQRDLIINDLEEETTGLANYHNAKKNIAMNK
jgi:hypothetical protein